jgi:hypothetical protein
MPQRSSFNSGCGRLKNPKQGEKGIDPRWGRMIGVTHGRTRKIQQADNEDSETESEMACGESQCPFMVEAIL